jgi:hypothetical protein
MTKIFSFSTCLVIHIFSHPYLLPPSSYLHILRRVIILTSLVLTNNHVLPVPWSVLAQPRYHLPSLTILGPNINPMAHTPPRPLCCLPCPPSFSSHPLHSNSTVVVRPNHIITLTALEPSGSHCHTQATQTLPAQHHPNLACCRSCLLGLGVVHPSCVIIQPPLRPLPP